MGEDWFCVNCCIRLLVKESAVSQLLAGAYTFSSWALMVTFQVYFNHFCAVMLSPAVRLSVLIVCKILHTFIFWLMRGLLACLNQRNHIE